MNNRSNLKSNKEWELLCAHDPLHAIASDPGRRKGDKNAWNESDFFKKGENYIQLISEALNEIPPEATILDLGRGAGRISRALASRTKKVIGVDVVPSVIELARKLNSNISNVEFLAGAGDKLPVDENSIDGVVSLQVIQHIETKAVPILMADIYRCLRKDKGIAILHVPAPTFRVVLASIIRLGSFRRILTKFLLNFFPNLDVTRRPFIVSHYIMYAPDNFEKILRNAGFKRVRQFQFRNENPLTTVYVAYCS